MIIRDGKKPGFLKKNKPFFFGLNRFFLIKKTLPLFLTLQTGDAQICPKGPEKGQPKTARPI